jgi:alpha-glucosidase
VRRLVRLRRERGALTRGAYRPIAVQGDLLLFCREYEGERLLVALNLGEDPIKTVLDGSLSGRILFSTLGGREQEPVRGRIELRANEGVIVDLSAVAR